jgi:hypothetical protein
MNPEEKESEKMGRMRVCPSFIINFSLVLALVFIFLLSCRKESSTSWQEKDSKAVLTELAQWRDTLDFSSFFSLVRKFSVFSQLNLLDSISNTGDSLVKIYQLKQMQDTISMVYHSDSLAFYIETDTFCDAKYEDYALHTISIFKCDTIWIVKYQKNPPDTIWRLVEAEKRPYTQGEFGKVYSWSAPRKLHLKKQAGEYQLVAFSGLTVAVPSQESAPGIQYVVLETPHLYTGAGSDTWYENDVSGLNPLDSLFPVGANESLSVSVKSEDDDTIANSYYFFIRTGGEKINITRGARFGQGKVAFESPGIKHIDIEVLPSKNLFYPNSSYSSTIWSIPVEVVNR